MATHKTAEERHVERVASIIADAQKSGYLTAHFLPTKTRRFAEEEAIFAWRVRCLEDRQVCAIEWRHREAEGVVPFPSTIRVDYGHIGQLTRDNMLTIGRVILGVNGIGNELSFDLGEVVVEVSESPPFDVIATTRADARLTTQCKRDAVPDVFRLLNDLILDHTR